jgi:hypothetical protein
MRLPNAGQATVPERKITAYLLSFSHRDGRAKAAFFVRFGFTADAWDTLAGALRRHAEDNDVAEIEQTLFGVSYTVEGPLTTPDERTPWVRVVWFVPTGEVVPRLVTAYPVKGAGR